MRYVLAILYTSEARFVIVGNPYVSFPAHVVASPEGLFVAVIYDEKIAHVCKKLVSPSTFLLQLNGTQTRIEYG